MGGPGTVSWDPCCNSAGYQIKPTVSALELTVDELEDKCRLKDHLIQSMADELRYLTTTMNWDDKDLIEVIGTVPNPSVDFDRRALACYLNCQATDSLQNESVSSSHQKIILV